MITKRLTTQDIDVLSRPPPDWDNTDPKSDLEELKSDSSEIGENPVQATEVKNKSQDSFVNVHAGIELSGKHYNVSGIQPEKPDTGPTVITQKEHDIPHDRITVCFTQMMTTTVTMSQSQNDNEMQTQDCENLQKKELMRT